MSIYAPVQTPIYIHNSLSTIKQNIDYFPCSPLGYNVILRPLSALRLAPSAHFPHYTIPVPFCGCPARLASGVPLADAPAQIVMAVCKWHGAVPKACYYVCRKTTNSGIRKWCLEVPYCFCEWDFLNKAQSQVMADEGFRYLYFLPSHSTMIETQNGGVVPSKLYQLLYIISISFVYNSTYILAYLDIILEHENYKRYVEYLTQY